MKKLELQTGYIADAIIEVKKKRFNEEFTTMEEVTIIKEILQNKIKEQNLNVEIFDGFFPRYFDIINGIITKADKETLSLKAGISYIEIIKMIYDEEFIYSCICEIMIDKLNNSIEHTCSTCNTECCGRLSNEQAENCKRWSHDFTNEKVLKLSK